jgi:hypothetical protein
MDFGEFWSYTPNGMAVHVAQYADYISLSSLSLESAIDESVASVAADIAWKMSQSLDALVAATNDPGMPTNVTLVADGDGELLPAFSNSVKPPYPLD